MYNIDDNVIYTWNLIRCNGVILSKKYNNIYTVSVNDSPYGKFTIDVHTAYLEHDFEIESQKRQQTRWNIYKHELIKLAYFIPTS
jgi:outer membrane receptor for monomeric catechols